MPPDDPSSESRLHDIEIKLAFLEQELALFKDAVQDLHARLERAERSVQRMLAAQETGADEETS